MPLTQTGATYKNQATIRNQNRLLAEALDDIASQVQAVRSQGNFGVNGTAAAPSAPTALQVTAQAGLITWSIVHPHAPAGTQWVLEYSTSPTFANPVQVGLLKPMYQAYLPNQTLYSRAAAKFAASGQSAWAVAA